MQKLDHHHHYITPSHHSLFCGVPQTIQEEHHLQSQFSQAQPSELYDQLYVVFGNEQVYCLPGRQSFYNIIPK